MHIHPAGRGRACTSPGAAVAHPGCRSGGCTHPCSGQVHWSLTDWRQSLQPVLAGHLAGFAARAVLPSKPSRRVRLVEIGCLQLSRVPCTALLTLLPDLPGASLCPCPLPCPSPPCPCPPSRDPVLNPIAALATNLSRVDTELRANHLGDNDHVSEVRLDWRWLLVGQGLLLCLSELLDEAHWLAGEAALEAAACACVDELHELLIREVEQVAELWSGVGMQFGRVSTRRQSRQSRLRMGRNPPRHPCR